MIRFDKHFFKYEMIGEFHADGMWIHPKRMISSYELIVVLDDVVYIRENNVDYRLKKDDILILSPNVEHLGFQHSNASFYWFHFTTDLPVPLTFPSSQDISLLKQLLKQLLHITNTSDYPETAADSLGYLIYSELVHLSLQGKRTSAPIIAQITEYIRNHCASNPSVTEIATRFGYTSDHLGKLFKKSTGIGLKDYISAQRIKQIKDQLLTTNKTIKQISADLGFHDENLFVKFFSYHEKISPSAFRMASCNTHINHR